MPIPTVDELRLPILLLFADGIEHSIEEIRERMKVQFKIASNELLQKHENGKSIFGNNVDLAFANLQGAPHRGPKAIDKVNEGVYKITDYGIAILKRKPSSLTIKDLS
jgi:restriction system protein